MLAFCVLKHLAWSCKRVDVAHGPARQAGLALLDSALGELCLHGALLSEGELEMRTGVHGAEGDGSSKGTAMQMMQVGLPCRQ